MANADADNYARARDDAQALLLHGDDPRFHHLLADAQEKLGDSLDAVREYERAAVLDASEPYLFDWGSELLLHRAPEPALDVFSKGHKLFPESVRMLIGMGAAWFARGSYDQAVARICEASDLDPPNPAPYLFLGKIAAAQTSPPEILVEKLHRFVTLHPESAEANFLYALGNWKRRKHPDVATELAEIESLLNAAVRLDPDFAMAYLQLGILHSEQGNWSKAISDYRSALKAGERSKSPAPTDEVHYRLAQAYRQAGEPEKAKTELHFYDEAVRQSALQTDIQRHEIRQFVYTLRDQPPTQRQ
jgi:tetratricopeptide (TPR) repeat protein